MKRIAFKPKTTEQASAALRIAEGVGRCRNYDTWRNTVNENAVRHGIDFWEDGAAYYYHTDSHAVHVSTLDELLAALTEKPKKEPKALGEIKIKLFRYFTGEPYDGGVFEGQCHLHWLLANGSVQVGCHVIAREDFERIAKAHAEYMQEDSQ